MRLAGKQKVFEIGRVEANGSRREAGRPSVERNPVNEPPPPVLPDKTPAAGFVQNPSTRARLPFRKPLARRKVRTRRPR
jgi:hypothetical protein